MERRKLGSLEVSLLGLGGGTFGAPCDEEQTKAVVHAALDAGVNVFDTADSYGRTRSEEFLGRILAGRRDEVVIATKFSSAIDDDPSHRGAGARWITQAVEGSLRRLGTDRIDLYQQHRPDPGVPQEETLEVLDALVRAGKVREIGNSNFSGEQIVAAAALSDANGWARFVSAQNRLNLLQQQARDDVVPACLGQGLGVLPYSPLAHGLLTGKYRLGKRPPPDTRLARFPEGRFAHLRTERSFEAVGRLTRWARARGHTLLELTFAWLAAEPAVATIIPGATRPEQVTANAAAVTAGWRLTDGDRSELDRLLAAPTPITRRARRRLARFVRARR